MHKAWLPAVIIIATLGSATVPALDGSQKLVKYGIAKATRGISTAVAVAATTTKKDEDDDDEKKGKRGKKEEQEVKIKFADAPAAVQKTLECEAFGAKIAEVDQETEDGKTIYEADVKIDGRNFEIKVTADGALLSKEIDEKESEVAIQVADCPAGALKTLQREALGAKVEKIDKLFKHGHTLYETDVKIDGKNFEIVVTADGVLLSKEVDEEEDGEQEEKIKFDDCPAAVQKTLKREASGAEIKHVVKETEEGKTTYEAEVKIDGQEYTIKVAADGTLLEKELEEEDEEVSVKFADAPAAVQKTLQREAAGTKIEKLDKLVREGRTLYEADAKLDGKNYEIIVTAEGLLLSKELDDEEEED